MGGSVRHGSRPSRARTALRLRWSARGVAMHLIDLGSRSINTESATGRFHADRYLVERRSQVLDASLSARRWCSCSFRISGNIGDFGRCQLDSGLAEFLRPTSMPLPVNDPFIEGIANGCATASLLFSIKRLSSSQHCVKHDTEWPEVRACATRCAWSSSATTSE